MRTAFDFDLIQPPATPRAIATPERAVPLAGQADRRIPRAAKLAFTAFMAVLVPFYWATYGPSNFLYFCDVALFLTLAGMWLERPLLIGMAAVGIVVPQLLWVVDFVGGLVGAHPIGMTRYMFRTDLSGFARGLSLFHGWLPFLLVWLVKRVGYDRRSLALWTASAWTLMLVSYLFLPAPGTPGLDPNVPVNVNYVYGWADDAAQSWVHPHAYLALLAIALPALFWVPAHTVLRRWCDAPMLTGIHEA